jgi:hypothetical protein
LVERGAQIDLVSPRRRRVSEAVVGLTREHQNCEIGAGVEEHGNALEGGGLGPFGPRGGRRWWAHLAFTRINIQLSMVKKGFEELMNVKGIGEKSFLKLKPLITVGDSKSATHQ